MKVVIAGGTGFLGQELAKKFINEKNEVVVLTRGESKKKNGVDYVNWNGLTFGDWCGQMENCDVLINLTGKSVDCRYTEANKKEIISSRVDSTRVLGEYIKLMDTPPNVWINASTATVYRHSTDKVMTEKNGEIGNDFSMNVAKSWEKAFFDCHTSKTRKIALRISLVIGKNGGVYPVLSRLAKFRLAGKMGSGKQRFAWVSIKDVIGIVDYIIDHKELDGPIICSSPITLTNAEFMKELRNSLGIKIGLSQPKLLLKIGAWFMRTESELILKSRWVYPEKLIDSGYKFKYPNPVDALLSVK